jgi:hypothetical protein
VRRVLVSVLAISALLLASAPASAQTEVRRQDISEAVFVPCLNEIVQLDGTLTVVINRFTNKSGRLHWIIRAGIQASGVGLNSGIRYQTTQQEIILRTSSPDGDNSLTLVLTSLFVSQGDAPDFRQFETAHYVSVDGEGKVSIENFRFECGV